MISQSVMLDKERDRSLPMQKRMSQTSTMFAQGHGKTLVEELVSSMQAPVVEHDVPKTQLV